MARLPRSYTSFKDTYPEIWQAYDRLGGLVHDAGPLDKKTRESVKLGIAIGARLEGAVHSHARRALEEGATPEEIDHVILLGVTTLGFPTTIATWTWVKDILKEARPPQIRRKRR